MLLRPDTQSITIAHLYSPTIWIHKSFADAIAATSRAFVGLTTPGSAINWGVPYFTSNSFTGGRKVIDVSGDGTRNTGANTAAARDSAAALGIVINGLSIGSSSIETWYNNNVRTPNGFVIHASSFVDFENAVKKKIGKEIRRIPEPATVLLLGAGLLGLAGVRRKFVK